MIFYCGREAAAWGGEFKNENLVRIGQKGGILFSYIPWKVSLSGEVGGYPQALSEVVTLREC